MPNDIMVWLIGDGANVICNNRTFTLYIVLVYIDKHAGTHTHTHTHTERERGGDDFA